MNTKEKLNKIKYMINFADIDESVKSDITTLIDEPVEDEVVKTEVETQEEPEQLTVEERLGNLEVLVKTLCDKIECKECNKEKEEKVEKENFSEGDDLSLEDRVDNLEAAFINAVEGGKNSITSRIDNIETVIGDALLSQKSEIAEGSEDSISDKLEVVEKVKSESEENPGEDDSGSEGEPEVTEEVTEEVEETSEEAEPAVETEVTTETEEEVDEDDEEDNPPTDTEISENFSNKTVQNADSTYGSMMSAFIGKFKINK